MTPRTKKRATLFPAYEPPTDGPPSAEYLAAYFDRLAQRVLTYGAVLVFITGAGAFLGIRVISPRDASAQSEARFKALEDTVRVHSREITDVTSIVRSVLYISCETLAKVQPAQSIPPQECKQ